MKVHFGTFARIKRGFYKKANDIIKEDLIVTYVLMDAFKTREFLSSSIINDLKSAYWIDILEALL